MMRAIRSHCHNRVLIILDKQQTAKFNLANPVHFLALGFGSGLLKPAPGTWGTLAAVPLFLLVVNLVPTMTINFVLLIVVMTVVGFYFCGRAADDVGVHDHSAIVWDEIVGLFITLAVVPPTWINLVVGFLLFRVFDIVKPWPIRLLDRHVHGGIGIMVDDVVAGILAAACLWFAQDWLASLV